MEKSILIIEDNKYKMSHIKDALFEKHNDINLIVCSSRNEAMRIIMNNRDIELIILDWNFPAYADDYPVKGMGKYILNMLSVLGIATKVIICSSENISIEHSNVIGQILYNPNTILSFEEFDELITKSR